MRAAVGILTLLLCFSPAPSATVLLPAEFREIVSGSQIIVHGRVVDVRATWIDGRRRIESAVTIEPASFMRGTPVERLTFRVPGGQIGRYKSVTVGAPEFRPGDEIVLFLTARGPSMPQVFGLNQGVFRVRVEPRTGRRIVAQPILMSTTAGPERVTRGARERQPLPLEQFTAQVRSVLQQRGVR